MDVIDSCGGKDVVIRCIAVNTCYRNASCIHLPVCMGHQPVDKRNLWFAQVIVMEYVMV